jgi:hypothetical protein
MPAFQSISVVCYLRNPVELAMGLSVEAIKGGRYLSSPLFPLDDNYTGRMCNYKDTIKEWEQVLPNFSARLFRKDPQFNVVEDFIEFIGLRASSYSLEMYKMNKMISLQQVQLLNYVNLINARHSLASGILEQITQHFSQIECQQQISPSLDYACSIQKAYLRSNLWVEDRFKFEHGSLSSIPSYHDEAYSLVPCEEIRFVTYNVLSELNQLQKGKKIHIFKTLSLRSAGFYIIKLLRRMHRRVRNNYFVLDILRLRLVSELFALSRPVSFLRSLRRYG